MQRKPISVICVISLCLALCSTMFFMTACGKDVKVKINDSGVLTEAEANTDMTVAEILKNAGISLGEKDETEPQSDKSLGEATEITVKRYAKVTVKNGKDEKTVELVGGTVEEAVKKAGFKLDESVALDVDKSSYLKDGMVITLSNGAAVNLTLSKNGAAVSLTVDGKTLKCSTHSATVKDFLAEQNITLGKDDEITPKLDEKITSGLTVSVKRVEYKNQTVKESINFETEQQQSSELASGETKVTQEGINGEKEVTYKVKYVDGKEASKEKVSEKVTKEPVNKIVAVGTASQSSAAQGSQTSQQNGKEVVSKQAVYNCDGSGHGYYVITYADGTVEYEEF